MACSITPQLLLATPPQFGAPVFILDNFIAIYSPIDFYIL